MSSNLDRYKADLDKLIKLGKRMDLDLTIRALEEQDEPDENLKKLEKGVKNSFEKEYQRWYTEAHAVVRQIIPERRQEFEDLYRGDSRRKAVNATTFTIQDWLTGVRSSTNYTGAKYFNDFAIVSMKFKTQLEVLRSANSRFETSLFDINQILQADLFDSELDAAKELLKNGFLRGAGAIAGVVLERHLAQVCTNHQLTTRKKNPSISDWNDMLKNNGVIDVPTWRFIQRLGDLRNLCDHNKDRDPTKEEVSELIDGAEKAAKTLF